ncbi:MAG: PTS sugar transporter subunit IIA [Alphaproteobacteria bacterium]
MKITDFLTAQGVIPELAAQEKSAVLREMAQGLAAQRESLNADQVLQVLWERERISTTAIGEGVAIPHGKLAGIERVVGVFARSPQGVDFAALDGEPTHLFFVLLAPENAAADHLKALARISRLLKDAAFRSRLMGGQTREQIFQIIAEEDQKF